METARALKDVCGFPFIFRAGVWKPRTSPHTFQGAGEEGLEWLTEVKRTFDIPVATEVATPEHVAAAAKAGIDYVWIGARTSANPLAVQAICERISGLVVSGLGEERAMIFCSRSVRCGSRPLKTTTMS